MRTPLEGRSFVLDDLVVDGLLRPVTAVSRPALVSASQHLIEFVLRAAPAGSAGRWAGATRYDRFGLGRRAESLNSLGATGPDVRRDPPCRDK